MRIHANDTNKKKIEIIYPELSYLLTGIFYDIHNQLGRFCRERQYADEFEKILREKQISFEREYCLENLGSKIKGNIVDFLIDNKILVDFKAKIFLNKEDYYQMQRYLESSNLKLGLLVNFRNNYLKPKRIINFKNHS